MVRDDPVALDRGTGFDPLLAHEPTVYELQEERLTVISPDDETRQRHNIEKLMVRKNMSTTGADSTTEDDRYATLAEEIRELAVYAPDEVVPGFYTIARLVEDLVEDRAKLLIERDECRKP